MKSFVIQQACKKLSLILIELLDGEESESKEDGEYGSGMSDESSGECMTMTHEWKVEMGRKSYSKDRMKWSLSSNIKHHQASSSIIKHN